MRKKSLILTLLTLLCVVAMSVGALTVSSAEEAAATNLATYKTLWNESWWTSHNNYATIDSNGIVFNEYGTAQAVAAVSLKEGLPYKGEIKITFKSEVPATGTPAGFLKVIFADCSGLMDGKAMKYWEIAYEHIAVEIQNSGVALWQYNVDNGNTNAQQVVTASSNNYIDGNNHTLTITYEAKKTAYDLKLAIDENVHFNGSIETTKLYCNNILTIGGYANSTVTDDLTVSSVTVAKTDVDPASVIDKDNLLGKAEAWTVVENENVTFDATKATLTVNGYNGYDAAVLKDVLPAEAKITAKLELNVAGDAKHKAVARMVLLQNKNHLVVLQIDDDGNMWLMHTDYTNSETGDLLSSGDWFPGLLTGTNVITITITPELTNGDEDVYVSVSATSKMIGLAVNDLSIINGNKLILLGGENGSVTYKDVKVEDQVKEKSTIDEVDMLSDAESWSLTGATVANKQLTLGGPGYAYYKTAIPVDGSIEFAFKATDEASAWYYLGISNFVATLWEDSFAEGQALYKITTSGTQTGFYTVTLNGEGITTKSSTTTDICDGTKQKFKFVTETVTDGLKVAFYRNDTEEFTKVYAKDSAVGSSNGFYLEFRSTGAQTADPIITDVKYTYTNNNVAPYNEAIATKKAIYALNANPTEENAAEIKASASALLAKLNIYTDEQLEVVNNGLYAEYVIEKADAILVIVADKAAANTVAEVINGLDFETITAENVEQAKIALADVKAQYEALMDEQKAYVTNYAKVETLEIAINDYELTLEPVDSESSSSTQEPESSSTQPEQSEGSSSSSTTEEPSSDMEDAGCSGTVSSVSTLCSAIAVAVAMVLRKKKEN